ncbi:hypothetical protein L1887_59872 [Cichorium endivia]|nr:hypothetical protein L1887_59872 [Cichorium endivia]
MEAHQCTPTIPVRICRALVVSRMPQPSCPRSGKRVAPRRKRWMRRRWCLVSACLAPVREIEGKIRSRAKQDRKFIRSPSRWAPRAATCRRGSTAAASPTCQIGSCALGGGGSDQTAQQGVRIEFECWSLAVQGCRAGPSAAAVATLLRQLFNLRAPQTIACIQSAPPYALVLLLLLLLLLLRRRPSSSLLA